jgi:ABC-type amino acid transport substrate-binding protein
MPRNLLVKNNVKGHAMRRALMLLGVSVALGSAATLAFAAKRIVARTAAQAAVQVPAHNAAHTERSGPQCVPSRLNRTDVLPGTGLQVSPLPDSLDAPNTTQISFLGAPAGALSQISVTGSSSGGHPGQIEAFSQGDGASFVPSRSFRPTETVVVHGKVTREGKTTPFAFHFTVALRDPIGHPSSAAVAAKASELYAFHSRPDLRPPLATVDGSAAGQAPGYIFAAPYAGVGQYGPMIFDDTGNLVWFEPLHAGTEAANLKVQSYEGKPVLTWWQGYIPSQGFGQGEEVIANSSYQQIMKFRAGNGLPADLHDFRITPQNTALLTSFDPIYCNLSKLGGPADGAITDSLFQELDLKTRLVRREWHPLDHVALTRSYSTATTTSKTYPFDYFHLNSVEPRRDGSLLISARDTSALYLINDATGQVEIQAGGKRGSLKLGKGTATAFQHDAEELPDGDISVFDNGGSPRVHPQSRAIVLALDPVHRTDTLVSEYNHPSKPLTADSQGNVQALENGNVFVGWGAEPYFSEYTPAGKLVFDVKMAGNTQSYRGYRFQWTGTPTGSPAVTASSSGGTTTVYASWNGATTIAAWRVLAGASTSALAPLTSGSFAGFETAIAVPGAPAYVAVQALDAAGNVLGTSPAIKG